MHSKTSEVETSKSIYVSTLDCYEVLLLNKAHEYHIETITKRKYPIADFQTKASKTVYYTSFQDRKASTIRSSLFRKWICHACWELRLDSWSNLLRSTQLLLLQPIGLVLCESQQQRFWWRLNTKISLESPIFLPIFLLFQNKPIPQFTVP